MVENFTLKEAAAILGKRGGKKKSERKRKASLRNLKIANDKKRILKENADKVNKEDI